MKLFFSVTLFCTLMSAVSCNLDKIEDPPLSGNDLPEFEASFLFESDKTVIVESVAEAIDSGYIITGYASSTNFSFSNMFIVKTSTSGSVQKKVTNMGILGTVTGGKMIKVADGYILAGTENSNDNQVVAVKLDKELTVLWTKKFGRADRNEFMGGLVQTASGDIIIAASNGGTDIPDDPFFLKIRSDNGTLIDSQTINIANNGRFFTESITRNGNAFGVLCYNYGISISSPSFMKIDENLNALISYKNQSNVGNNTGVIVAGSTDGFVLIDGISAQLERQAYITSLNGNGEQTASFDQFSEIPESGFLGGSRSSAGKYIPCGWGAQVLGTDQFGIAALISPSLSTEATYTFSPNGKLAELTASSETSDGGYILAGMNDNAKEIVLVKLNSQFKLN